MSIVGDRLFQSNGIPVGEPVTQGTVVYVRPSGGSASAGGRNPQMALKTLVGALAKVRADRNDIVRMLSDGNASALATDYQTDTLEWAKDGVHLLGFSAGGMVSQRCRIAWKSTATASVDKPLLLVSASNCRIEGISVFAGIADANLGFGVKITGHRNVFRGCHFAGIGHDTNDVAGAYSLCLYGGTENLFEDCVIGLDTITRGSATNTELLLAAAGTADCNARNIFRRCYFISRSEAAGHTFVTRESAGSDRFVSFENCIFINTGTTMTEAISVTAGGSPAGAIYLKDCGFFGVTHIEAAPVSGAVLSLGQAKAVADDSIGAVVAAT